VLHPGSLQSTRFIYDQNGTLVPARIRDLENASTVDLSGSYRRSGSIITCTFTSRHGLTANEEVTLGFESGAAVSGTYTIYKILSDYTFTVVSTEVGSTSGVVQVSSNPRGTLQLYNPSTSELLLNNIGFVSYLDGLVQLNTLYVKGFPTGIKDIKITSELLDGSKDLNVYRNQILRIDDSTASSTYDQLAGLTITVVPA
jgi:hypothetical protein